MTLRFIGVDPDTGQQGSPTIWIDDASGEIIVQGWKPSPDLEAACAASPAPGHTPGIPAHEAVVRIPARRVPMLREACDVAERTRLS
ncbi:hypothetical protein [Streptomyces radicis]|uniref:Uncharacterized protein n=1 Tax=Streptomyces radicis TaxID=1750517 RepID=A0A3A9WHQ7_9ACTN|nr:hypothetical protein [Streptomyces radicis]RKN12122.1 hypothetical protein D7319_04390 [Streptomyces radicis]RKN25825.1 hypothetical protein D7318_06090 [Streptomyces radicis]